MQSHVCIEEITERQRSRPDVDECEQFGVFDVRWIFQPLKEVIQNRYKLLALVALSRRKEQHHDTILEDADNLALCVEFILVPVVLYQNPV